MNLPKPCTTNHSILCHWVSQWTNAGIWRWLTNPNLNPTKVPSWTTYVINVDKVHEVSDFSKHVFESLFVEVFFFSKKRPILRHVWVRTKRSLEIEKCNEGHIYMYMYMYTYMYLYISILHIGWKKWAFVLAVDFVLPMFAICVFSSVTCLNCFLGLFVWVYSVRGSQDLCHCHDPCLSLSLTVSVNLPVWFPISLIICLFPGPCARLTRLWLCTTDCPSPVSHGVSGCCWRFQAPLNRIMILSVHSRVGNLGLQERTLQKDTRFLLSGHRFQSSSCQIPWKPVRNVSSWRSQLRIRSRMCHLPVGMKVD
jgi:hypothetical protein